jgi:hypothetical protein
MEGTRGRAQRHCRSCTRRLAGLRRQLRAVGGWRGSWRGGGCGGWVESTSLRLLRLRHLRRRGRRPAAKSLAELVRRLRCGWIDPPYWTVDLLWLGSDRATIKGRPRCVPPCSSVLAHPLPEVSCNQQGLSPMGKGRPLVVFGGMMGGGCDDPLRLGRKEAWRPTVSAPRPPIAGRATVLYDPSIAGRSRTRKGEVRRDAH